MNMNQVRKKFVLYAMLAVFVLLLVLLGVINGTNFTMAAADADAITERLSQNNGRFNTAEPELSPSKPQEAAPRDNFRPGQFGPMGPSSPEIGFSTRYFTVRIDKNGEKSLLTYQISAVSEEEALSWAESLQHETIGWTHGTYRYRVYTQGGSTFVTVIDQGRELLPSYRILIISLCGMAAGLLISFLFLHFVSKKLFAPLEDADRKQKQFMIEAEKEFKVPLTVIQADTELIERESGPSDYTSSIRRQVRKMTGLVKDIGNFAIFREGTDEKVDLTALCREAAESWQARLEEKGIDFTVQAAEGIVLNGSQSLIRRLIEELFENISRFADQKASLMLSREKDRIRLEMINDTTLPDGSYEMIFDRFRRLDNAKGLPGSGLGLSFVRDAVKELGGRVHATVSGGLFILQIAL